MESLSTCSENVKIILGFLMGFTVVAFPFLLACALPLLFYSAGEGTPNEVLWEQEEELRRKSHDDVPESTIRPQQPIDCSADCAEQKMTPFYLLKLPRKPFAYQHIGMNPCLEPVNPNDNCFRPSQARLRRYAGVGLRVTSLTGHMESEHWLFEEEGT